MKIYVYQTGYVPNRRGKVIGIFELEAEEREKTYKIIAREKGVLCSTTVRKDSLDQISTHYSSDMFSLSNDKLEYYKNLLIERENRAIERYKEDITSCEAKIEEIKALDVVKNFEENPL